MSDEKRGETFTMKDASPSPQGPINFTSFLMGLASSALIHLGAAPHPETGQKQQDLVLARQSLDLLALLREKTRGNLTAEEERLFDGLLTDLRFRFVEAAKR
ncbi:MAG TPA: DUF1844 domain-containing protein [Myxococcaceae bacterium]|jgi:hypothetical protein